MGLIKADMKRYGGYLDFTVTKGWLQSLYSRMNMFRHMVITSRPIVTSSLWEEVKTQFHNDIASAVLKYNIPDELILNIDKHRQNLCRQKMLRWLRLDQSMFQEKAEMINVTLLLLCQKQSLERYCLFN